MKIAPILLLVSIIVLGLAENPAIVAVVEKPVIEKARDQYFADFFTMFGTQPIPDMKSGDIKTSGGSVTLTNASPSNLDVSFDKNSNAMIVQIQDTRMEAKVHYKYKKAIISVSGDATIKSTLKNIKLNILLGKTKEGDHFLPQVTANGFDFGMSDTSFKLTCHHCPGEVEKLISKWMKGDLIKTIEKQVRSEVPKDINTKGNQVISQVYPRTLNLLGNIDMSTVLTDVINVGENHIEVPVDGTVFLHDQGYKRPHPTSDMPHFNPEDAGEMQLFLNDYLLETLDTVINAEKHTFEESLFGLKYEVSLDPELGSTTLSFLDGDLFIDATPRVFFDILKTGVEFEAQIKMNPDILNGSKTEMMSVNLNIDSIDLRSLKLILFNKSWNLSPETSYINWLLKFFLNFAIIPKIKIPKTKLIPLKVTGSEVDFHEGFSELGISFKFE